MGANWHKPGTCGECRWADDAPEGMSCRRHPPTEMRDGGGSFSAQPMTSPTNWCGEWAPLRREFTGLPGEPVYPPTVNKADRAGRGEAGGG